MTAREVGLGVQGDRPPEVYPRIGRLAEEAGFDVLSVFNDLFFRPAIVPLLLLAQATERVRLGPAGLNPFTLHPVEIAGQIASLDSLSGGRAYLGLVRGAWLESVGVESRPVGALREAVEVVRRLLAGDTGGYVGDHFRLAPGQALAYEVLRPSVPLLIGAWGEGTAALAGEVAEELKLGGSANPEMVHVMRRRIGNDGVRIVVGAVTVVDEDGEAARRLARAKAALYFPVVAKLDPTLDPARGEPRLDDVLDRFAFAGTPEQVAAQAEALYDAGAHRVEFGTTDENVIELLAERVLPRLR